MPKAVVEEKFRYLYRIKEQLQISLTTFTNKLLQEWEKFLNVERKKLLKKIIDLDKTGTGVLKF